MKDIRVLAINPGSTSTKIAVYQNTEPVFLKNIKHTTEDLAPFANIADQFHFRKEIILQQLKEADVQINDLQAVVGRGGLLKPIPSGIYEVNEQMIDDLKHSPMGEHASNLGGLIAHDLVQNLPNAKAYIVDPIVVDEFDDIARISGHPLLKRISIFHALNQKAVAREYARSVRKKYEDLNLIVVHLGGGITVGAHYRGRVIDVNQGLDGEGPFTPERSGTLPTMDLVRLCFSGKYAQKEVAKMVKGEGGLVAYLGTNNAYDVEKMVDAGDAGEQVVAEFRQIIAVGSGQADAGDDDARESTHGLARVAAPPPINRRAEDPRRRRRTPPSCPRGSGGCGAPRPACRCT